MSNTITANVGVALKLQGVAHSITSACATSADAIGYAYNLIQLGKQDLMLAGGGEEDHWSQSLLFDAMGTLGKGTTTHLKQLPAPTQQIVMVCHRWWWWFRHTRIT